MRGENLLLQLHVFAARTVVEIFSRKIFVESFSDALAESVVSHGLRRGLRLIILSSVLVIFVGFVSFNVLFKNAALHRARAIHADRGETATLERALNGHLLGTTILEIDTLSHLGAAPVRELRVVESILEATIKLILV